MRSLVNQKRFSKYGFACLVPSIELEPYIQQKYFPKFYRTVARIILDDYTLNLPEVGNRCPRIIHMPSVKAVKGTADILDIINSLKNDGVKFDFTLLDGVERKEAMNILADSDILVDEIISGTFGLASIEAMAMGKVVINYIKPALQKEYPESLPILSATRDDLYSVLKNIISDVNLRVRLGRQGRAYVENYHDAHKVARDLIKIYEEEISRIS
jgi:hypothetical protein